MPLLFIAGALILYGIFALFSVSIHESFTTTLSLINRGKMIGDPSNYFYFFKQLVNLIRAVGAGFIIYFFPLKALKNHKFLTILSVVILLFQILVFVPGVGVSLNGARGWLDLPGLPSIQPAEFFKIGYVIFLARWLIRKKHLLQSFDIMRKYLAVHIIIFFVFVLIPDIGSVLVMGLTGLVMMRYVGVKKRSILQMLLISGIAGIIGLTGLFAFNNSMCQGPRSISSPKPGYCKFTYITRRIEVYINPDSDVTGKDSDRQNKQALIAIGAGGLIGQGYGKGLQKFGYIPEAQSDFIFAAFAEESGFLGTIILLGLYGILVWFTMKKVPYQNNEYLRAISVGLLGLIIIQVFVNIGVNTKIIPNTGLTLPFISYGGTALMTNVIMIILLHKILYEPHTNF